MLREIKNYFDKRAEKKFRAKLTESKIQFDRLYNLYGFKNITTITMCFGSGPCETIHVLNESVEKDDDKALQSFVDKGGKILYIHGDNLYKKAKHCKKMKIPYIITTNIWELCYNK